LRGCCTAATPTSRWRNASTSSTCLCRRSPRSMTKRRGGGGGPPPPPPASDLIVVCDPPVGPGNLRNLELALEQAEEGELVVLLDSIPIAERDFTGGRATELWQALRARAIITGSYEDAVATIAARAPAR